MDTASRLGELMFGRRLRLRVLLWVNEQEGEFHQTDAARGVDYSSTGEVAKELERLAELGMVRKFGRNSRFGAQLYVRIPSHPGWEIARSASTTVSYLEAEQIDSHQEEEKSPQVVRLNEAGGGGARGTRSRSGNSP